ncbi:golgin subfamily A member 7B-like [Lates japonicus]
MQGLVPTATDGNMATEFHNLQELRHSASLANKVFIQRDYSEGTTCKFQTKFPSELESRVRGQEPVTQGILP